MEDVPPPPPTLYRSAAMIGMRPIQSTFKHAHEALQLQMNACCYILNNQRKTKVLRILKRVSDMLELASMWITPDEILETEEASEFITNLALSKYRAILKMNKFARSSLLSNFELARYFKREILVKLHQPN